VGQKRKEEGLEDREPKRSIRVPITEADRVMEYHMKQVLTGGEGKEMAASSCPKCAKRHYEMCGLVGRRPSQMLVTWRHETELKDRPLRIDFPEWCRTTKTPEIYWETDDPTEGPRRIASLESRWNKGNDR